MTKRSVLTLAAGALLALAAASSAPRRAAAVDARSTSFLPPNNLKHRDAPTASAATPTSAFGTLAALKASDPFKGL